MSLFTDENLAKLYRLIDESNKKSELGDFTNSELQKLVRFQNEVMEKLNKEVKDFRDMVNSGFQKSLLDTAEGMAKEVAKNSYTDLYNDPRFTKIVEENILDILDKLLDE